MPYTDSNPPEITYVKREGATPTEKEKNYDNLIEKILLVCPGSKIKTGREDFKSDESLFFQMVGYSTYTYKDKPVQFSFLLSCEIKEDYVIMTINGIHIFDIFHSKLEKLYFSENPDYDRKYNPSYQSIDTKIKDILHQLCQAIQ